MITIRIDVPHCVENFEAAMNLRATGMFSDEEIQRMYDEQVRLDLAALAQEGGTNEGSGGL